MTPIALLVPGQVPIGFVRDTLHHAIARGIDWQTMLRKCAIDPHRLNTEGARVPVQHYAMLQQRVADALGDEMLGYGNRVHKIGLWKNACRASLCEGSLRQVLSRLLEFFELFDAGPRTCLLLEGDEAVIEVIPRDGEADLAGFAYEQIFAAVHRFAIWLVKQNIALSQVTLRHQRRYSAADAGWLFQTAAVVFGQTRACIRFDRRWLDMPVKRDARNLEAWLKLGYLGMYDVDADNPSWAARLREIVGRNLPDLPEFCAVATQLKLHPQTLRRRLAAEGLNYQDIKDQVRREAAEYYLNESALSIEEIAFRSGFSEASGLIRAFKRWTGTTPHRYSRGQRLVV